VACHGRPLEADRAPLICVNIGDRRRVYIKNGIAEDGDPAYANIEVSRKGNER
jgi:hypothetical protein